MSFTFPPFLLPYNTSPATYLTSNPGATKLVVGAVITNHHDRVLLIQRAAHDGFPLKWECPGGCVDDADESVLHAVCREVLEETGLVVTRVLGVVDQTEFEGKEEGWRWRKITFLVEVEVQSGDNLEVEGGSGCGEGVLGVRLDPAEHCDAVWASEEEVMAGSCGGREIEFAYEEQRKLVLKVLRGCRSGVETVVGWVV
ncbi:hypothetical protein N656DRAFT_720311 [Canariomyces notabilis]|uniref:Nudix hydrolase domain-containing protein n=1 Tax=Canariomyces notabilis TaxID=2074819 RepID=A0AAN6QHI3_9PEZI|nr:hypothetical protein N656DRAFT_720311 [Canariomyces arenarius]